MHLWYPLGKSVAEKSISIWKEQHITPMFIQENLTCWFALELSGTTISSSCEVFFTSLKKNMFLSPALSMCHIFDHSCCVLPLFSLFVLIHLCLHWRWTRREGGRVPGTEELHSRPPFHLSTSRFQLQRNALKANSETFPHPQRTKAERTQVKCETIPFLFTLSSPFRR